MRPGSTSAQFLRPGDHIVWGQACGEPTTLVEALIAQAESIGGLSAFAATSFSGLLTPEAAEKFSLSSMGAIGALRTVAAAGRLGIVPCHVSQVGPMIEQGLIGCDVAFVQVSPPDANGNHSFGLISDFVAGGRGEGAGGHRRGERARAVHASAMRCCRPRGSTAPFMSRARRSKCLPAQIGETDLAIAKIVAGYIEDGAVLQVGIGAVPDAILRLLHDRRDLGVHSGMIGDGLVDLVEAGVITNARKPIDAGVSITGALIGTKRLYEFADRNPQIGMRSSVVHAQRGGAVALDATGDDQLGDGGRSDRAGECRAERRRSIWAAPAARWTTSAPARARRGGRSIIALARDGQGRQDQPHHGRAVRVRSRPRAATWT